MAAADNEHRLDRAALGMPAAAAAIRRAAASPGHLVLDGVFAQDEDLELLGEMRRFFALPASDPRKAAVDVTGRRSTHGWMPLYGEPAYQAGTLARVESFDCGRPTVDEPRAWPDLPGFREAVTACWERLSDTGFALLGDVARSLALPRGRLADVCRSQASSTMRLLHYPGGDGGRVRGETGISAHTDFECLTLLYQTAPGLELRDPSGRWTDAVASGRQVYVLFGDMLERFTNGRIRATAHRVRLTEQPRLSFVLFFAVDDGVTVSALPELLAAGESPRFRPVTQREHSERCLERAMRNRDALQRA